MYFSEKSPNIALKEIISYTPPKLYTGKEWYVGFYAFDPARGQMRRKKIKLNFIAKTADRRRYANALIKRLHTKLESGWNPWIECENGKAYHTMEEVFTHYRKYIKKMLDDNIYREDTYVSYLSYLRNIEKWNNSLQTPYSYIYQFDSTFVQKFLEHVYIDRNNTPQTHNNYLIFLSVFSTFLVQNQYLKTKPTEGFRAISKRLRKKQRTIIAENDMAKLKNHLEKTNKHYLLACYILYYCFIRPKEMSLIQLKHISIKNQTIFIPGDNSKNTKDGMVTIPKKVLQLMIELNVFAHPNSDYLFSNNFYPGSEKKNEKMFRDYWTRYVRSKLGFPATYKFYSLKDTGITAMLRKYDSVTVRDQARHADILMTDTYTPHDLMEANPLIKDHESDF